MKRGKDCDVFRETDHLDGVYGVLGYGLCQAYCEVSTMIRPEQIPDEVVEAAHRAFYAEKPCGFREALAAAIAAWPGVYEYKGREGQSLSLPLTQETSA